MRYGKIPLFHSKSEHRESRPNHYKVDDTRAKLGHGLWRNPDNYVKAHYAGAGQEYGDQPQANTIGIRDRRLSKVACGERRKNADHENRICPEKSWTAKIPGRRNKV